MKNLRILFLLILLSSFSANFSAFGMNSDSEGEKRGTKRSYSFDAHEEKRCKVDLELSDNILDYPDVLGIIFSKLSDVQDFLNVKHTCKKWNEITNKKFVINAFLKKQRLRSTRYPTTNEILDPQGLNNYLIEQENLFVQKYSALLSDFERSEIREIVVNLTCLKFGDTLLHEAAWNGYEEIVRFLLQEGARVDMRNDHRATPLCLAIEEGHTEIVRILLQAGAKFEDQDSLRKNSLYLAASCGRVEILKILLQAGAKFDHIDDEIIEHLLCLAVEYGYADIVRILLEIRIKIDVEDKLGKKLLYLATRLGHAEVVRILLQAGASGIEGVDGKPLLHLALEFSEFRYSEVIKVLVQQEGVQIDKKDKRGITPLFLAAEKGNLEALKILLQARAKITEEDIKYLILVANKEIRMLLKEAYNRQQGSEKE